MDLQRLRHILAVADTGSFSRAAEEVCITQPGLSRSIAAFEQDYGVRLFDRGRSGVAPTPAGLLVITQARAMLAAAGDLERSLRLYGKGEGGSIGIGFGPLLASLLLPRLGQSLARTRPGMRVTTISRPPHQLLAELLNDNIEMIFANNWYLDHAPGTESQHMASLQLSIVVRREHPLASANSISIDDLSSYIVASPIELPSGDLSGDSGSFICENFHILREVALETDCIWRTSPCFVEDDLAAGRLVQLNITGFSPITTEICVIVKRSRSLSPAATDLIEEVKAMLTQAARDVANH